MAMEVKSLAEPLKRKADRIRTNHDLRAIFVLLFLKDLKKNF